MVKLLVFLYVYLRSQTVYHLLLLLYQRVAVDLSPTYTPAWVVVQTTVDKVTHLRAYVDSGIVRTGCLDFL